MKCPDCGATEPFDFIGKATRAAVRPNLDHYRDEHGALYCRSCFVVWDVPRTVPAPEPERAWNDGLGHNKALHTDANFKPEDAERRTLYSRLHRVERRAHARARRGGKDAHAGTAGRFYDAHIFASFLGLPREMREIAARAVLRVSECADWRRFRSPPTYPRSEAVVLAILALVLEDLGWRADVRAVLAEVRFLKGPREVKPEEFEVAKRKVAEWLEKQEWTAWA